jgi:hypothetical protein
MKKVDELIFNLKIAPIALKEWAFYWVKRII